MAVPTFIEAQVGVIVACKK